MGKQSRKILSNKNWRACSLWIFNANNWGFDYIKDKHTLYRGKDCMKKFCESLREQAKSIIDFEKKKSYR